MWVLKQELGSLRLPFSPIKPCTEGVTLNRWCQTLPWQQVSLQTEQRQDRVRQRQAGCPAGMLPPTSYLHNQLTAAKGRHRISWGNKEAANLCSPGSISVTRGCQAWPKSKFNYSNWLTVTLISSQELHWEMQEAGKDRYPQTLRLWNLVPHVIS